MNKDFSPLGYTLNGRKTEELLGILQTEMKTKKGRWDVLDEIVVEKYLKNGASLLGKR